MSLVAHNIERFDSVFLSPEDSLGTDPVQQKGVYDDVIRRHPESILSLQHEVYGKRCLVSDRTKAEFHLNNQNLQRESIFHSSRIYSRSSN